MTPKEKAIEFIDKFWHTPVEDFYTFPVDFPIDTKEESFDLTKQCALIAVEEIVQELTSRGILSGFWYEVKQEIKKL